MEEEEVRKDGDWVRAAMGGGMRDGGVLSQLRFLIAVKRHHGHNMPSFSEILYIYIYAFPVCMSMYPLCAMPTEA